MIFEAQIMEDPNLEILFFQLLRFLATALVIWSPQVLTVLPFKNTQPPFLCRVIVLQY